MDFNRIVPALEGAFLKVGFKTDAGSDQPGVEYMWVKDVYFDGVYITGKLSNQPKWVSHLKEGDEVKVKTEAISDWLAVISEKVYGGFTVQVTRSRLSEEDREKHDEMWGLEFPDIPIVNLPDNPSEFEPVLARLLKEQIDKSPDEVLNFRDSEGRSLLHLEALYGRSMSVATLLDAGYDRDLKCKRGWLAATYAKEAGWSDIAKQIEDHQ